MKSTLLSLFASAGLSSTALASTCYVYVGSYTKGPDGGISLLKMDEATGKLENLGVAAAAPNPSFLAVDAKGEFLYAIYENSPGSVAAYRIDRTTGKLTLLNKESAKGDGPCHIIVDKARKNVLVSNYGSGSVACLPIKEDGSLAPASSFHQHVGTGPNKERQEAPHAHGAYLSADEKFALVADLGMDRVVVYHFDAAKGLLTKNEPPAGIMAPNSGPRHGTFSPDGSKFYVINEMACSVSALTWNATTGTLKQFQDLPTTLKPVPGNSTAEIFFHPNGNILYGSNRGDNSIVRYSVDKEGKMKFEDTTSTTGPVPRGFAVHPSGKWMIAGVQDANKVVTFAVDPVSGKLTLHGEPTAVGMPVCIVFLRIP